MQVDLVLGNAKATAALKERAAESVASLDGCECSCMFISVPLWMCYSVCVALLDGHEYLNVCVCANMGVLKHSMDVRSFMCTSVPMWVCCSTRWL